MRPSSGVIFWLLICVVCARELLPQDPAPNTWPPKIPGLSRQYHQLKTKPHLPSSRSHVAELCSDPRCGCTASQSMSNVSCHCSPQDQEAILAIHPSSVPRNVSILMIEGCRNVVFHDGGIKNLPMLVALTVIDVGEVIFQSGSFNQAHVELETIVTIGRCRQLVIKSGAFFSHPLKPVAFYSSQCNMVRVEESAFSRLHRLTLDEIQLLELSSYAFRFATTGSGARANIALRRVTMTELNAFTFPSPLDRLRLDNVTILGQIMPNATTALRIVELSIVNSHIGKIATGAFSHLTHLDSVELSSTAVDLIDSEAFASATSSFVIEGCMIGLMNHSALSMPAARVTLSANHIRVLATGALNLREWNQLFIENNTVVSVERHAFYNIGEPSKLPTVPMLGHYPEHLDVRFVIRRNIFHKVDSGAFIISAQALKLQLEDNQFLQLCDCQMGAWTAELTQVSRRRTEITTRLHHSPSSPAGQTGDPWDEQKEPDAALWLGTSLFNSSSCWLDQAAVECSGDLIEPNFLSMNSYVSQFCSPQRQTQFAQCLAVKRAVLTSNQQNKDLSGLGVDEHIRSIVGFIRSDQDLLLVIILAVLAAMVLLAVFLGLVFARRRTKSRQQQNELSSGSKILSDRDDEERMTSSPLIADEKQLSNGAMSSGSITCLSVKEYRTYLEELGPIYSEPLDPPFESLTKASTKGPQLPQLEPPELPAKPAQWTPNKDSHRQTLGKENGERGCSGRNTIDRGTQTLFEPATLTLDNNGEVKPASLAQEFTEDVLSALKEKLDISPTYSEVKDSIKLPKKEPVSSSGVPSQELYDLIRVVDSPSQPETSVSLSGPDHIYCKPWTAGKECDPLKSPLLSADSSTSAEPHFFPASAQTASKRDDSAPTNSRGDGPYSVVDLTSPSIKSPSSSNPSIGGKQQLNAVKKPEPFHIRGSLPKWPPPARDRTTVRPPNNPPKFHSLKHQNPATSTPISPTKDTKPSWRSAAPKPVASKRASPVRNNVVDKKAAPHQSPKAEQAPIPLDKLLEGSEGGNSQGSPLIDFPSRSPPPPMDKIVEDDKASEYSEVTTSPFSFSFRRPLFSNRENSLSPDRSRSKSTSPMPGGLSTSPTICEYADPRDRNDATEPLYSELTSLADEDAVHNQS